jgi:hypothetical protein
MRRDGMALEKGTESADPAGKSGSTQARDTGRRMLVRGVHAKRDGAGSPGHRA